MSLFNTIPSIPAIKLAFNIGSLFDIPTGTYYKDKNGQNILVGGMHGITSVVGPGNSFKSTIAAYMNLTVASRIKTYQYSIYDSESSLTYNRIKSLSDRFPNLAGIDFGDETIAPDDVKYKITSSAELYGDEYFELIKKVAAEKIKHSKPLVSPIIGPNGKPVSAIPPSGIMIDSLSEFRDSSNEEKFTEKNAVGDSANNMMYMRAGLAKKLLIGQLPNLNAKSSLFFTMTAHVGTEFQGGMYDPKPHKLTFAKAGSKVTGVTKAFDFINNAVYEIHNVSKLTNKERNTGVLYPLTESDRSGEGADLMLVKIVLTRNKAGLTGAVLPIVLSQREGLLPELTQFHYIKLHDKYGISGNNTTYHLDLLPDVNLTRTTVRPLIDSNPALRRTLEITSELHQIQTLWPDLPEELLCTPKELYDDIVALGYDWGILLNTRGWWVFEGYEKGLLPFLTTMDLLQIRKGNLKLTWYDKEVKNANKGK